MTGQLQGQVALVTGGGRGFGKAIALRFAAEGAAVTVTARTQAELDQTVKEIESGGGRGFAVAGNVTRPEDVARVVKMAQEHFGPVTLFVNDAGLPGPFAPAWAVDPDEWWQAQEVHIRAPFMFIRALLPSMVERHAGRIIVVSAKGSHLFGFGMSAYCVGKRAQNRLVEFVAAEAKDYGVAAFAIDPGFVVTELAQQTLRDPGAQRWSPFLIEGIHRRQADPESAKDLDRCAQRCLELASGRYDVLSGGYTELTDNLDELLAKAHAAGV